MFIYRLITPSTISCLLGLYFFLTPLFIYFHFIIISLPLLLMFLCVYDLLFTPVISLLLVDLYLCLLLRIRWLLLLFTSMFYYFIFVLLMFYLCTTSWSLLLTHHFIWRLLFLISPFIYFPFAPYYFTSAVLFMVYFFKLDDHSFFTWLTFLFLLILSIYFHLLVLSHFYLFIYLSNVLLSS